MSLNRLHFSPVLCLASLMTSCHLAPTSSQTALSPSAWTIAIKPQFSGASDFSEGVAAVLVGGLEHGKWGYINKSGEFIINPQFDGAQDFSEGLAAVRVGTAWGFIDRSGKMVINPQFQSAWPWQFKDGLAAVEIGDNETGKWGFVDKAGNFAVSPQFDDESGFSGGLAKVGVGREHTKWGFIDKQGRWVINPQFDDAEDFADGFAAVRIGEFATGKHGYINSVGAFAINPQFDDAESFEGGLAAVRIGPPGSGKYGYIDKQGRFVITRSSTSQESLTKDWQWFLLAGNMKNGDLSTNREDGSSIHSLMMCVAALRKD